MISFAIHYYYHMYFDRNTEQHAIRSYKPLSIICLCFACFCFETKDTQQPNKNKSILCVCEFFFSFPSTKRVKIYITYKRIQMCTC